eukprot:766758-Hanusia_phi.AAC.3
MSLELQSLPGARHVQRILIGTSENRRRSYISLLLRSSSPDIEELRYFGVNGGFLNNDIRRRVWPLLVGLPKEEEETGQELESDLQGELKDAGGEGKDQQETSQHHSMSDEGDEISSNVCPDPLLDQEHHRYREQIQLDIARSVSHLGVDEDKLPQDLPLDVIIAQASRSFTKYPPTRALADLALEQEVSFAISATFA